MSSDGQGEIFMKITLALTIVYIISFIVLLKLVYSGNKKESSADQLGIFLIIFVAGALALLPTAAIGIILFVILGSTSLVDMIFSLNISINQLIILAISLLVYLFTLDHMIDIVLRYTFGENIIYHSAKCIIRIGAFYLIGEIIAIRQTVNMTMAVGTAVIILIIESLHHLTEKTKHID